MRNGSIKILAIDDNHDNLISIKALVQEALPNAQVLMELSGMRGLALAASENPDMILLDIVMPEMDGYQVCTSLKADEKLNDIPVVFVTANKGDKESRINALKCGADAFLSKPIDETELIAQILAMVKIKAANSARRDEKDRLGALVEEQTREILLNHLDTLKLLEELKRENDARKRSEEALIESEGRYRSLFQGNQSVLLLIDPVTGEIKDSNPAASQFYGWSITEMCCKNIFDINTLPREEVITKLQNASNEEQKHFYFKHRVANGEIKEVEVFSAPIIFKGSTLLYSLVYDITDRISAEEAARKSREHHLVMLKTALEGFWLLNNEGYLLEVNDAYCRMSGYSESELLTMHISDLEDIETKQYTASHILKIQKLGEDRFETRHRRKNGSLFDVEISVQYKQYDGGRFVTFLHDITDHKKVEKQLNEINEILEDRVKERTAELASSEKKYKLLSENIRDGIFIYKNNKLDYNNNAFSTIFGYTESELPGTNAFQLILPEYQDKLKYFLSQHPLTDQIRSIEMECLKKDLSTVYVEMLINYVASEKAIYGVVHDITERKQIQKNIVKAIIQTEEKEKAIFSKELHDGLGPLLSTIKLYLQWSQRPNTITSNAGIIHKAEEILEDALVAVKEISNKLSPHLLTNYGLTSATQSFVDKLKESGTLKITFQSNAIARYPIEVESALYRAIIECINNTIHHASANNIYILLKDTGNQLILHYQDDGIGFNMSETVNRHSGLGLFNLQNRITSIGGKIVMNSKPGRGVDYQIVVNINNPLTLAII